MARLDAYNNEPNVAPGLLALENVVLPHLGGVKVETRDAMGYLVLDGTDAVLAGRTAGNLVEGGLGLTGSAESRLAT